MSGLMQRVSSLVSTNSTQSRSDRRSDDRLRLERTQKVFQAKEWNLQDFDLQATIAFGTFGRIRLVKMKEAAGNMADRMFILKIFKKSEALRLGAEKNITKEALILSLVSSPWLVNVLTRFQDETRLFSLMEFVNGGDLQQYMKKEGAFSDVDARFYGGEVVLGLQHLHSAAVVYRDLRPENVLLTFDGHIKLADFGFSKVLNGPTYTLCGTPEYMAPEIIQSKGHGLAVDWWAFGAILFEMMTGESPFAATELKDIFENVLQVKIKGDKRVDKTLMDLIKRLLKKEVESRLGSRKGAHEIMNHSWFANMDWEELADRSIRPPITPAVDSEYACSMFDTYPDTLEDSAPCIEQDDQDLFKNFTMQFEKEANVGRISSLARVSARVSTRIATRLSTRNSVIVSARKEDSQPYEVDV